MKTIMFVDHEIGYRLLEKVILQKSLVDIVVVVTTDNNGKEWWPGVSELCNDNNIHLLRYEKDFKLICSYTNIDFFLLLSWKYIIPIDLINKAKKGVVNLHYSLLPELKGVYPVNWAIIEGKKETGVTYHFVDKNIDAGQIVCQKSIKIDPIDTARSLQLRLDDIAYSLFDEMLIAIVSTQLPNGTNLPLKKGIESSYKSYDDYVNSNEIFLNCNYSGNDFFNLLRGKTFFPDNKNLYITSPLSGERIYINVLLGR